MALGRRWLVIGLLVAVVAVALVVWRASAPRQASAPPVPLVEPFGFEEVPISSPDLQLAVVGVRGVRSAGSLEWSCLLRCLEPEGCYADVVVTIHYRGQGEPHRVELQDTVTVAEGGTARVSTLGRLREVTAVDRVEVAVERRFQASAPSPTPED